jgi:hypothetical protein
LPAALTPQLQAFERQYSSTPADRAAFLALRRASNIDDDVDDKANSNNNNININITNSRNINADQSSKRKIDDVTLTNDEQEQLDALERQRNELIEQAKKRKRDDETAKLQQLLCESTEEQRAILLSLLNNKK